MCAAQGTLAYRVHFSYAGEPISPWHDIPLAPHGLDGPLTFCCESASARGERAATGWAQQLWRAARAPWLLWPRLTPGVRSPQVDAREVRGCDEGGEQPDQAGREEGRAPRIQVGRQCVPLGGRRAAQPARLCPSRVPRRRFAPPLFLSPVLFNYGFFPQTWEDPEHLDCDTKCRGDNDPLDVVEVGARQMRTGECAAVKVLGLLGMIDDGETDWKVFAIRLSDPLASKMDDLDDLERELPGAITALREWLRVYKVPEGKALNCFSHDEKAQPKAYAMKARFPKATCKRPNAHNGRRDANSGAAWLALCVRGSRFVRFAGDCGDARGVAPLPRRHPKEAHRPLGHGIRHHELPLHVGAGGAKGGGERQRPRGARRQGERRCGRVTARRRRRAAARGARAAGASALVRAGWGGARYDAPGE